MELSWTHQRAVVMADPDGLHFRNTCVLCAYLRQAAPGTRFAIYRPAPLKQFRDFGEAKDISAFEVVKDPLCSGERFQILSAGPDAEYVLDAAEEAFGEQHSPGIPGHFTAAKKVLSITGGMKNYEAFEDVFNEALEAYRTSPKGLIRG